MPYHADGFAASLLVSRRCGAWRNRCTAAVIVAATIQSARNSPTATSGDHVPIVNGNSTAVTEATMNAHLRRVARSGNCAWRQLAIGPTPIRNVAGAIRMGKTRLKYGGPTEALGR